MRGASEGEGLGNKFLANIREADAICQVVRAFEDGDVVHVDGKVSPSSDIETIHTELVLADLQTLEKAVVRLEKESRIKKESKPLLENALAAQKVLEEGNTLYAAGEAAGVDLALAAGLGLLTTKPFIYVFNLDEDQLADADLHARLGALVAPADAVFLNAKLEVDLMEMSAEDALEMLQSFGAEESGLDQLARVGFHTLGLQTYLTAGPEGVARVDDPPGLDGPAGRGRHPHRLPARASSRPRSCRSRTSTRRARWPRHGQRGGCAWRARSTSCRTATSWSSASTSESARLRRSEGVRPVPVRTQSARSSARCARSARSEGLCPDPAAAM